MAQVNETSVGLKGVVLVDSCAVRMGGFICSREFADDEMMYGDKL